MVDTVFTRLDSKGSLPDQIALPSISSSSPDDAEVLRLKSYLKPPKRKITRLPSIEKYKKSVAKGKYFTQGSKVNEKNAVDLSKEQHFDYPKDLEEFAYKVMTKAWRNEGRVDQLKKKCCEKMGYKEKNKMNLLNRLYVKDPPVSKMRTVLDVDPKYFDVIEGRPIADKLDIHTYIHTARELLRTKIVDGYRQDDIMLIEENILLEQNELDSIEKNYQLYVNNFEEFLFIDHTSAMDLLRDADKVATTYYDKYEEYKAIEKKYSAMRSCIYNLEEKWKNCKMYQKFLFTVSPMPWRLANPIEKDKIHSIENIDKTSTSELLPNKGGDASLTDILNDFLGSYSPDQTPAIFFTQADQLMDVFKFMETQNLNCLLHSEELAAPLEAINEGMRTAEILFDEEIANMRDMVDRLEGGIFWQEERAKYLDQLGQKLIYDNFQKLIMDEDVLNLHVFVEDVYETRIGPNDANLSMLEMMNGISKKYRNELLLLDQVPSEEVALLEGTCYTEQMRVMKLAEKAARQYAELERLTMGLNKAFAPAYKRSPGKQPVKRSPILEPRQIPEPPPRELTEEEEEFLEFFTDFCKYTDDPKNYGIDTRTDPTADKDNIDTEKMYGTKMVKGISAIEKLIMTIA